jgi:hypothetical protein
VLPRVRTGLVGSGGTEQHVSAATQHVFAESDWYIASERPSKSGKARCATGALHLAPLRKRPSASISL